MTRQETSSSPAAWSSGDLERDPHRAPDKAARVQRMFSSIAASYDLNNRLHSFGRDQSWRRRAVRLASVSPRESVLDAACGTGDLALAFARAGAAKVIGVDFTEEMLEIARLKMQRARRDSDRPSPTFQWADVMDLPFDDESFDIVSIAFGIRNVDDPPTALREFYRVIRPGGRLIILEFAHPRNSILRACNAFYCRHVLPFSATLISGDRSGAYRYLPRSIDTFLDAEALRTQMDAAGFGDIEITPMTFGVCNGYLGRRG